MIAGGLQIANQHEYGYWNKMQNSKNNKLGILMKNNAKLSIAL